MKKRSHTCARLAAEMPAPRSATVVWKPCASPSTATVTPAPSGEKRVALSSRLVSTVSTCSGAARAWSTVARHVSETAGQRATTAVASAR